MADLRATSEAADASPVRNWALDLLGVYILPPLCLSVDFAISGVVTRTYPLALLTFAALSMAAFALSGRTGPGSAARPLLKGMILAAGLGALLIGLALLPLSSLAFALGSGLGLLGLAPLLTAHRLWRRARRMEGTGDSAGPKWAGALLVAALPALAMALEVRADQTRLADLRSKDRARVLRALSPDAVYGPGDLIRDPALLRNLICDERNSLPMDDPEVEAAVHRSLGVRDEHGINDRCDWRRRL